MLAIITDTNKLYAMLNLWNVRF